MIKTDTLLKTGNVFIETKLTLNKSTLIWLGLVKMKRIQREKLCFNKYGSIIHINVIAYIGSFKLVALELFIRNLRQNL